MPSGKQHRPRQHTLTSLGKFARVGALSNYDITNVFFLFTLLGIIRIIFHYLSVTINMYAKFSGNR